MNETNDNLENAINHGLIELLMTGDVEMVEDDKFQLTDQGRAYAQRLIKLHPEAARMFSLLCLRDLIEDPELGEKKAEIIQEVARCMFPKIQLQDESVDAEEFLNFVVETITRSHKMRTLVVSIVLDLLEKDECALEVAGVIQSFMEE